MKPSLMSIKEEHDLPCFATCTFLRLFHLMLTPVGRLNAKLYVRIQKPFFSVPFIAQTSLASNKKNIPFVARSLSSSKLLAKVH